MAPARGRSTPGGRLRRQPAPVRGPRPRRSAGAVVAAVALAAAAAGCAKEEAPPGALPDQRPPDITEIVPASGSVVPDFDDDVVIRLDEPVQFSGSYGRDLEASPAYRYRVRTGFSDIRVRPEEGWRPGAVYVLRLPGGFRDLLGNRREEPIEVIFSTGPEVTDTRVAGRLLDRLTGEGVRGARVLVLPAEGDSIPYTAVADTGGVFSLPAVPPGDYVVHGFRDLNRDLSVDRRLEPHDSASIRLDAPSSSVELTLRMIPPDSTPPALLGAAALDSLTVVLVLDDPLDPARDLAGAKVAVRPAGEDAAIPLEGIGPTRPSPAGPPEAGDTAAAAPQDTVPLPSDSLFLRLGRPLEPERTYRASASGLVNLRGLEGGGDTTFVYTPADTAGEGGGAEAASPDSADAGAAAPDTARSGADGAPADTAPADTARARGAP